ncbi:hypothetical protein NE237_018498 [Protea cynaroides]|uniref:Peptidase A1 domain-containing protein n=1 Tax=Protea cynaroides TaxID=273540 RepID=A0A9Q0KA33_9MAGN|nr:hypothetical protein NE237_018498 [Protea cynaroides]
MLICRLDLSKQQVGFLPGLQYLAVDVQTLWNVHAALCQFPPPLDLVMCLRKVLKIVGKLFLIERVLLDRIIVKTWTTDNARGTCFILAYRLHLESLNNLPKFDLKQCWGCLVRFSKYGSTAEVVDWVIFLSFLCKPQTKLDSRGLLPLQKHCNIHFLEAGIAEKLCMYVSLSLCTFGEERLKEHCVKYEILASESVRSVSIRRSLAHTFSYKLIHRYSEEAMALRRMMLEARYQLLFPAEGSDTMAFGNELAWLHYTWVDIGTPNVSFLVALDTGSDLLWVPCDCIQCAPLSASNYNVLDKDMSEYSPSSSSTGKHLSCSHKLCESGLKCKSPTDPCPYIANYLSGNTSSSGLLVEDILHLSSSNSNASKTLVKAPVIVGCGRKQSGDYLDGVAPDGLLGLGFGDISVPSLLAKSGLVRNSFSICFDENDSGRIFFGDQGLATQQTTPLLPLDGKYKTYIVEVKDCCIGNSCLEQTGFHAQVDSGTSFTFLPDAVFEKVAAEFDRRVNATRSSDKIFPFEYCYEASSQDLLNIPSVTLMFAYNNSFVVHNPVLINGSQGLEVFCLAIMPGGEDGTIGQNFLTGYRLVFDRENLKLGWSRSSCQDLSVGERVPLTPTPHDRPQNPLPTNQQQSTPGGRAVAPAVAGRTPSQPSAASPLHIRTHFLTERLLPMLLLQLCLFTSAT